MKGYSHLPTAVTTAAALYDQYNNRFFSKTYDRLRRGFEANRKSRTGSVVITVPKPKPNSMATGTYSMVRRKHYHGRKLSGARYIDKLSRTAVVHQVERYSKVSDAAGTLGTNRGSTFLNYGDNGTARSVADTDTTAGIANTTLTEYPVHLFNLTTTRANPSILNLTQARCGWKLCVVNSGGANANKVVWDYNLAYDRNTQVDPNSYPAATNPEWEIEDSAGSAAAGGVDVGRQALLEWSEIRCLFYGKVTRPTYIKCSFVQFNDPEYAPDFEFYRNGYGNLRVVSNAANEYWKTVIQPLVNNPCTITNRTGKYNPMRVLSSYVVKIAPKDTSDADQDPHQQYQRWFNRWNRMINYSYESTAQLTNLQLQDPQFYPSVAGDVPVSGVCKYPKGLRNCVYFMITSYNPEKSPVEGPNNQIIASYDFNIRKSTGIITA